MNINELDRFLQTQDVPGVVAMAMNPHDITYEGAFGVIHTGTGARIDIDTPHAIMSMTKPITSVAIMQLVEAGKLELDAPAKHYVPDYAEMEVLNDVDTENKRYTTSPLTRDFTVRHLLTHTAGFGYAFCNETLAAFGEQGEQATFPLSHQPGESWAYGISTRILGEIISAVTDKELEDAFKGLIFDPLGMTSTSFQLRDNQPSPHVRQEGKWVPVDQFPPMPFGDGGLISTARDYARFLQCLLNDGEPLLGQDSFRSMVTNQIGELFITRQPAANPAFTYPFPTGAGVDKFGLGFQLHMQPEVRSPGSYSWCGLLNTYFWGDPVKKIGGIVLMQILPLYDPVCLETLSGFEKRVYS